MNTIKPPRCPDCGEPVIKERDGWYHLISRSIITDFSRPSRTPDVQLTEADYVREILMILGHASQGTLDPERGEDVARRALAEACDNREGK